MRGYFWEIIRLFGLFCAAGICGISLAQDYDREQRWRAEIEPTVLVGDAVDLTVGERKVFAIFTESAKADKRVGIVLVHGVGVHPDHGYPAFVVVHKTEHHRVELAGAFWCNRFSK